MTLRCEYPHTWAPDPVLTLRAGEALLRWHTGVRIWILASNLSLHNFCWPSVSWFPFQMKKAVLSGGREALTDRRALAVGLRLDRLWSAGALVGADSKVFEHNFFPRELPEKHFPTHTCCDCPVCDPVSYYKWHGCRLNEMSLAWGWAIEIRCFKVLFIPFFGRVGMWVIAADFAIYSF